MPLPVGHEHLYQIRVAHCEFRDDRSRGQLSRTRILTDGVDHSNGDLCHEGWHLDCDLPTKSCLQFFSGITLILFCRAPCREEEHRAGDYPPHQHTQDIPARWVHLLHVVEHEQCRPTIGCSIKHLGESLGDPDANGLWSYRWRFGYTRICGPETRRHSTRLREPSRIRPAHAGFAHQQMDELRDRREGDVDADFLTAYLPDWPGSGCHGGGEPPNERALADPGGPGHETRLQPARPRLCPQRLQLTEFLLAADEDLRPLRDRVGQRSWLLLGDADRTGFDPLQ